MKQVRLEWLETKKVPIDSLEDFQGQLKNLTKDRYNQFKKVLIKDGFTEPVSVWKNPKGKHKLLNGHQRLRTLKMMRDEGYVVPKDIPANFIEAKDEKEAKRKLLSLASQYGEVTEDGLYEFATEAELTFQDLKDNFNFPEINFDKYEKMFETDPQKDATEDEVPELPKDPISKFGDLYELGEHRLLCGDSTDKATVEKLMNGEKADMVFTDPPYGIDVVQSNSVGGGGPTKFGTVGAGKIVPAKTYRKIAGDETTEVAKKFYETSCEIGFKNIVLFGGNYFTDFLPPSRCWFIWDKEMTGNFSQAEMAWTNFEVGGVRVFKFLWNGLSREGNRKDELKGRIHPTQKPVGLFEQVFNRLDKIMSVFDGFGGSGSTLIACEKTKRKCFMMELDPHYIDVIVSRWCKYTNQTKIKKNGKEVEWSV